MTLVGICDSVKGIICWYLYGLVMGVTYVVFLCTLVIGIAWAYSWCFCGLVMGVGWIDVMFGLTVLMALMFNYVSFWLGCLGYSCDADV